MSKNEKIVLFVLLIGIVLVVYLYYNKQENLNERQNLDDWNKAAFIAFTNYLKQSIKNINVIYPNGEIQKPININAQTLIIFTNDNSIIVLGNNIMYDLSGNIIPQQFFTGLTYYDMNNMIGFQYNKMMNHIMSISVENNQYGPYFRIDMKDPNNRLSDLQFDLSSLYNKNYKEILSITAKNNTDIKLENAFPDYARGFPINDIVKSIMIGSFVHISNTECGNTDTDICNQKKNNGECEKNPFEMFQQCRNTCNLCNLTEDKVKNLFNTDIEKKLQDLKELHNVSQMP